MPFTITDWPCCEHDDPRVTTLATQKLGEAVTQWVNGSLSFPFGGTYLHQGETLIGSINSEWKKGEKTVILRLSDKAAKAFGRYLESLTGLKNESGIVSHKVTDKK